MTLLLKVMWSDSLWAWLSLAGEVNRLVACPFHCSPSCAPWFLLGFCSGFSFVCLPLDFSPVFGFLGLSSSQPVRWWSLGRLVGHALQGTLNELSLQCPRA